MRPQGPPATCSAQLADSNHPERVLASNEVVASEPLTIRGRIGLGVTEPDGSQLRERKSGRARLRPRTPLFSSLQLFFSVDHKRLNGLIHRTTLPVGIFRSCLMSRHVSGRPSFPDATSLSS